MKQSRLVGMHRALAIMASVLFFTVLGCDSPPQFLTKSDQDSLAKLHSGQYTLVSSQELSAMKQQADSGQNTGRYHIFRGGAHTWRLDTDTGRICLLMASADDWKQPELKAQGCSSSDQTTKNGDKRRAQAP